MKWGGLRHVKRYVRTALWGQHETIWDNMVWSVSCYVTPRLTKPFARARSQARTISTSQCKQNVYGRCVFREVAIRRSIDADKLQNRCCVRKAELNLARLPIGRKNFFFSSQRPDRLWGPPSLLSHEYGGWGGGGVCYFTVSKAAGAWS
jgi:hypothetical protein